MNKFLSTALLVLGGVSAQWGYSSDEPLARQGRLSNTFKDKETLEFSYKAARLAKHYQAIDNVVAQQNWLLAKQSSQSKPVRFSTKFDGIPIGRPKSGSDIFGYRDSMNIVPSPENKENRPNPDVQREQEEFARALDGVPTPQQQAPGGAVNLGANVGATQLSRPSSPSFLETIGGESLGVTPLQSFQLSRPFSTEPFSQLRRIYSTSVQVVPSVQRTSVQVVPTTSQLINPITSLTPVVQTTPATPVTPAPVPFIYFR